MMSDGLDVMVWSDYLCPWCYVGLERAEHLEREHGAVVTWLPYDLHPEIPEGGVDSRRAFDRVAPGRRDAFMERIATLAEEAGLPFNPPEHISKTRNALEVSEWVRQEQSERFSAFHEHLFQAYWVDGRDLERVEVLRDIAEETGVDASAMAEGLAERVAEENVDQSTELAQRAGVTGTPGWLIEGKVLVPGAQPHDTFDRVITRLREKQARGDDTTG